MNKHVKNRDEIIKKLREELVGPAPCGTEIDCEGEIVIDDYKPRYQKKNGEEILRFNRPTKRYGVGVLYPEKTKTEEEDDLDYDNYEEDGVVHDSNIGSLLTEEGIKNIDEILNRNSSENEEYETGDFVFIV